VCGVSAEAAWADVDADAGGEAAVEGAEEFVESGFVAGAEQQLVRVRAAHAGEGAGGGAEDFVGGGARAVEGVGDVLCGDGGALLVAGADFDVRQEAVGG